MCWWCFPVAVVVCCQLLQLPFPLLVFLVFCCCSCWAFLCLNVVVAAAAAGDVDAYADEVDDC